MKKDSNFQSNQYEYMNMHINIMYMNIYSEYRDIKTYKGGETKDQNKTHTSYVITTLLLLR